MEPSLAWRSSSPAGPALQSAHLRSDGRVRNSAGRRDSSVENRRTDCRVEDVAHFLGTAILELRAAHLPQQCVDGRWPIKIVEEEGACQLGKGLNGNVRLPDIRSR